VAALRAAKTRLAALQAETSRQLAIQRAGWAKVSQNAAAVQAALAAEAKSQRELASRIATLLERQRQFGNIPSVFNGTLSWPSSGVITQEFGCTGFPSEPPLGDCAHFHQGIDIAAPMYTPIHAAGDGVVLFAGPNPYDPYPKAWIVIIAHSDNLVTWYAHVDNAAHPPVVSAGQHVTAGQVVAYVGMTGNTTGPHLHWAIEYNNQFVNPRLFV
jgi:murein DD-endopeptidase MepM/ murein hydrolase activator NlpD